MQQTKPTPALESPAVAGTGFDPGFLGVAAPLLGVGERDVVELGYTHFSVQLDTVRALAVCAAVNIDGASLVDLPRADAWQIDPRDPVSQQVGEEVYARNDLDRGHLVRRRDPCWGAREVAQRANVDTFHYVNPAPQVAVFNQSKDLCLGLETYVLDAAAAAGARLSVFTGPVLAPHDPVYRGVAIPRRFYKIAAWADEDRDGALVATGYVLDQSVLLTGLGIGGSESLLASEPATTSSGVELGAYRTYQVPITDIETLTGLDFTGVSAADQMPVRDSVLPDPAAGAVDESRWVSLDAVERVST